jgi:hypothetical protein
MPGNAHNPAKLAIHSSNTAAKRIVATGKRDSIAMRYVLPAIH